LEPDARVATLDLVSPLQLLHKRSKKHAED
jgi:hypothetical protein